MSNILPLSYRTKVMHAARARFILVGAGVLSVAAAIAILALLPAFLSVYLPRVALSNTPPSKDAEQTAAARGAVSSTRTLINELKPLTQDKTSYSQIVGVIFDLVPSGVTINNIQYTAGKPGTITVSGTTARRENISIYREALARDKRFDNVTVPVAALVGILAGNFTVTLTGTF